MAECKAPQTGTICWNELMTRDAAAAKKFYGELLGWTFKEDSSSGMAYTMFTPPGAERPIGGLMQMAGPQFQGVPPHWLSYILVDNVDQRAQRCTKLGGQIKLPPTDIPKIGRFCVIQDPTGAVIALFQSA